MKKVIWIIAFIFFLFAGSFVSAQKPFTPRDTTIKGPQTFAMIMGVSKYIYVKPLVYADKDAELFKDYLQSPGGGNIKEDNIYSLLNDSATNTNFLVKGSQWLNIKKLQQGDRLFIYLAGHGDAKNERQPFFLSYDCNPRGDKNNYLINGAIRLYDIKVNIADETKKGVEVFFIMDACRSSELPGGIAGQNFVNNAISEKTEGEVIMLAASAGQKSLEDVSIGNGHGLFTYYLVDGLSGVADTIGGGDNKVTFREIQAYVEKNVPFVAEQHFKRKQDPYFCCAENNDKVISTIDTTYLQKWLETKKQENKGAGNSYRGFLKESVKMPAADTGLVETYDRFYAALHANKLTGDSSAENYFEQLNKKYPGNPYTLDAKSTLAVKFINVAQAKVDRYLGCGDDGSAKEKQDNYEAALNLEKAINSVREDNKRFASSLYNLVYFLKACSDFGKDGLNGDIAEAFKNAYAALAIDPDGAYLQNKLALLHLANNKTDSALYYANEATKTAPNWPCAFTTLALVQDALAKNEYVDYENSSAKISFDVPEGKILVRLPDEIAAGETISGTVTLEPGGENKESKNSNLLRLMSYTMLISDSIQVKNVSDKTNDPANTETTVPYSFSARIPDGKMNTISFKLKDVTGKPVSKAAIKLIASKPVVNGSTIPTANINLQNRSTEPDFVIQKKVLETNKFLVVYNFQPPSDLSPPVPLPDYFWSIRSENDSTMMQPLCGTSGKIVFLLPNIIGRCNITAKNREGKTVFSDDINLLSIKLTNITKPNRKSGDRISLGLSLKGLDDCPYPVRATVVNKSAADIILDKGNNQTYSYDPVKQRGKVSSMDFKIGGAIVSEGSFWIRAFLIFPATTSGDLFHQQKSVLNTPEEYNTWIAALKKDLKASADNQGNDNAGKTFKVYAQRAIDNIPDCDDKSKLDECKAFADSYLRPLNIPKDIVTTWACGLEAYKAAVKSISATIAGNPEIIYWEVIKDGIEFISQKAEQLKNKKLQKDTDAARSMVESIQKNGGSEKSLKELKDKLDELNSGLTGK